MAMNHDSSIDGYTRIAGCIVRITVMIASAGLLLAGCIPITPEEGDTAPTSFCARWSYAHWQNFDFGSHSSVDDLLATVRKLYDVDGDNISIEKNPYGQTRSVIWTANNADYNASLTTGDRLTSIKVQWRRQPPTMAQLVDCLGPPASHYEATNYREAESYWVGEAILDLYPGFVSPHYFQGVSSPKLEWTPQAEQPDSDYLLERLRVFRVSISPEQAYEAPGPSACARLSVSHWQEFRFGVDSLDDVVATVIRLWDIDRNKVEGGKKDTGEVYPVLWSNNDKEEIFHAAHFSPGGKLIRVSSVMIPGLTLAQIIDCLGPPDYYVAYVGPYLEATDLTLYYIEEGFSVRGIFDHRYPGREPLERIPPEFGISEFDVDPLSLEELARRIGDVDDDGNLELCILRLWPGSIEALEIDKERSRPAHCD